MYDIIVIGAGPAGLSCALNSARAGKSVLVLEKNAFGGQIANSPRVENYPSVMEISGSELADKMFEQCQQHGVEFDMGDATLQKTADGFEVTTDYGQYTAKAVVLATGVSHRKMGFANEQKLEGNGVCYCAVCDGAFFSDKSVAVIGDGNTAVQYALYLANICQKVYIITMFDKFFSDKELIDRLLANGKIEWIKNSTTTDFVGDDKLIGLQYKDEYGAITYMDVDGVFVAIGQVPHNEQFADIVELDKRGFIVADESCKTSAEGVFTAGDCRTKTVRQCATAVSDGAVASFQACAYVDFLNK